MIINSLLDTDLYKFTMMQAVLHQFPQAQVEYAFKCRNNGIILVPYIDEIKQEIRQLCQLKFKDDELLYLRKLRFIKSDFVDFLALFHLNEKYIEITPKDNGEINIKITGPWLHTILFEVPVLAIVNEVYFRNTQKIPDYEEGWERLNKKIDLLQGHEQPAAIKQKLSKLTIADYGTRRRFSHEWHVKLLQYLIERLGVNKNNGQLAGTSNVLLAKTFNITPLGTMAHEYLQACQALGPTRLRDSQKYAFESWAKEYRGDLGIALSDVYGFNAFLRDFDLYFCKLFDGTRHDSGDPIKWGNKMIAHYQRYRIDPLTKSLIFSDGLTIPKIIEIFMQFYGRCQLAFGIGTNLTNDLGYEPLQIVLKMVRCNGEPVAKISDSPGKSMCDDEKYLTYLRQVFDVTDEGIY